MFSVTEVSQTVMQSLFENQVRLHSNQQCPRGMVIPIQKIFPLVHTIESTGNGESLREQGRDRSDEYGCLLRVSQTPILHTVARLTPEPDG